MTEIVTIVLQDFLARFTDTNSAFEAIQLEYEKICRIDAVSIDSLIPLYDQLYPELEKVLWSSDSFDDLLVTYQALFREQEALIRLSGEDDRFEFILSIPIADRPEHLQQCLESIYQLCLLYNYGGQTDRVFDKVRVVVAEDSELEANVEQDRQLADQFTARGLRVTHFGLDEQYQIMQQIDEDTRRHLGGILTTQKADQFYHKGQAANRNLSYLKMQQMTQNKQRTLYYLVDSDQSFVVNRQAQSGEQFVAALNYFYTINRIFSHSETSMLTGKLVGDPPVSPSVMASNFLHDVIAFLHKISALDRQQSCQFHSMPDQLPGDAAYHDMAGLFGFKHTPESFDYRCRLTGSHTHEDCLNDFSARLDDFFFGEHLTRKTVFQYQDKFETRVPARTIYPGNYIVNYAGLKYVIPFGHLRLRMSGPTAGRLVQAEIGERFASANIPMLHKRTTEEESSVDFRPGVKKLTQCIDLSDEFERQFFGDLMLFSVIEILQHTDLKQNFDIDLVTRSVDRLESEMLGLYESKHKAVVEKNAQLQALIQDRGTWLHSCHAAENIQRFIDNIDLNFGSQSKAYYQQIMSPAHRAKRKQQIIDALMSYRCERAAWDSLFS